MYRDYETAAGPMALEYGGGGYIAAVDGQKVAPAFVNSHLDADKFVIQGYALRWNTLIHVNHSEYAWVAPYAIRDLTRGVKRLHFDHNESRTIGTNSDGLILVADEFSVAMRFYPRSDIAIHREAVETVRDNVRTALSVGIEFHNKQFEQYDGKRVRIVRDATISEVSLVPTALAAKHIVC